MAASEDGARLYSGTLAETKAALEDLREFRRGLRPRPSSEEVEGAQKAVAEIDRQLIQDLEQLMLTPCPAGLEQAQFASLQALRESRLRKDAELAQRSPLAVLDLDEQHRHYDHLIMAAERALFLGPQPIKPATSAAIEVASPGVEEWQDKKSVVATPIRRAGDGPTPKFDGAKIASMELDVVAAGVGARGDCAKQPSAPCHEDGDGGGPLETLARLLEEAATSASSRLDLRTQFAHQLAYLPDAIGDLRTLTDLNLSENRLPGLPSSIGALGGLLRLEVQYNKLRELPPSMGSLAALTHLDLRSNCLEELPPEIGSCARLQYLNVGSNKLKALPEAIGGLVQLTTLVASLNHLRGIPHSIGGCAALTTLDVHFNEIGEVPAALGLCTRLQRLDLGSNFAELRGLPASLGQLSALQELTLSNNSIRELPDTLGRLGQLKVLRLEGNPLKYPNKEIVAQGMDALLAFLAEQQALGEAKRDSAKRRSPLLRLFSKMVRRKPKDLIRAESLDDLKRLA